MNILQPSFVPVQTHTKEYDPIISLNEDGSVRTRFSDETWDFRPYIHGLNVAKSRAEIRFSTPLINGSNLLDEDNRNILISVKECLYVRIHVAHPRSGKRLSPQSVIAKSHGLRALVNFMLETGLERFSQFEPRHCKQYIAFLKRNNPTLSNTTLVKYLGDVEDLYHLREYLNDALTQHPWPESSAIHLSNSRVKNGIRPQNQTPRIPDDLCVKLFTSAVDLIEKQSHVIQNVAEKENQLINEQFEAFIANGKRSRQLTTTQANTHAEYLISRTYKFKKEFFIALQQNGFNSTVDYTRMQVQIRTACYVVISMLTGMRNSEIGSLTTTSFYKATGWDNEEYCWLRGLTYKLEDHPKPAKWMVPSCVKIAIDHLVAMNKFNKAAIRRALPYLPAEERHRQAKLQEHLFICYDFHTAQFNGVSNPHWNRVLQDFSDVFECKITDPNNDLNIAAGNTWPLRSHQFRRTFACLAARSALGDLRYLREHYKHWSLDMTLHYAKDSEFDTSLFDEVYTERNDLQRSLISDWMVEEAPLAGGRGLAIATFKQRGSVKTAKTLESFVNQISDSVFIRGTGHSWCLTAHDGCGGEGIFDALLCVDCKSAVIDKTHVPVWKGLKRQHEALLDLEDSGDATRHKAKQYIACADELISKFTNG